MMPLAPAGGVTGDLVNSSKTWKSGERCRVAGTYRCAACQLDGRSTERQVSAGAIMPMCDICPEKDATWRLIRPSSPAAAKA